MENHITLGEWLVSVTAVIVAVISVAVIWATVKLTRVTAQVATIEMAKVSTNANDDMRDVALASIAVPKPPVWTGHRSPHQARVRIVRKELVHNGPALHGAVG